MQRAISQWHVCTPGASLSGINGYNGQLTCPSDWSALCHGTSSAPTGPTITPTSNTVADKSTEYFAILIFTLPYSESDFTTEVQRQFAEALAKVAGTDVRNVEIVSVEELGKDQRRAGEVVVIVKVRAVDQPDFDRFKANLGTAEELRESMNQELEERGLKGIKEVVMQASDQDTISGAAWPRPHWSAVLLLLLLGMVLGRYIR